MKHQKNKKGLVIATSRNTRGGITTVVKVHEKCEFWSKYKLKWISTHKDGCNIIKYFYLIKAIFLYVILLPFHDIIHVHMAMGSSAKRKSIFIFIASLLHKKIILHFHPPGMYPHLLENGLKDLYIKLFNKSDVIIVLSDEWKRWIKTLGIDKKVTVVFNPCLKINTNALFADKKNNILFAATINQRKGYIDLIKSFSIIAKKYPEWKVILAGNGEIEKGKKLAKELKISNQVEFKGWVSGQDKENLFLSSSIFCLSSYGEGFPMSVIEAWSYGLPVITTPVGGLPDIIIEEINALTYDPGDIKKLSLQLEKLITNNTLRNKLSKESIKLIKENFDYKIIDDRLISIYKNVLKK